jgi:hypothetical protein
MSAPLTIDIPHKLGKAGARERLRNRAGELASHIPGGMADVRSSWPSEDEMALEIAAMGQTMAARLEVHEALVRVHLILPPMLGMFSGMIGAAVRESGTQLLEDKRG